MSQAPVVVAPGWQTEELQDEWVDLEPDVGQDLTYGTLSISLTSPLSTKIHADDDLDIRDNTSTRSIDAPGTVLVREDVPDAPILPKTPGRKKGLIKDIFTPLPLETMFEPPSPPSPTQSQVISADLSSHHGQMPGSFSKDKIGESGVTFDRRTTNMACQFTFAVPREHVLNPNPVLPQAQSTPNPQTVFQPKPPPTDPRLRLFQFQYDTYTREHLSAMVDSIAINTPSGTGTTPSPTSYIHQLSRLSEVTGSASPANISHLRSAKRVKLSPLDDYYGEGAGSQAMISRPKLTGKDYVGESQQLMQQIKLARDFSTISTTVSTRGNSPCPSQANVQEVQRMQASSKLLPGNNAQQANHLAVPNHTYNNNSLPSNVESKRSPYSASSYRQQAEALMAQIKQDMKGHRRMLSADTELTQVSTQPTYKNDLVKPPKDLPNTGPQSVNINKESRRTLSSSSRRSPSRRTNSESSANRTPSNLLHDFHGLVQDIARVSFADPPPRSGSVPHIATHEVASSLNSLGQPSYPSSSNRPDLNEELNRFVSSSTTGTSATSGSAPSFVKHAGPAHIRTIAPQDVPSLPERFGDMVFDKVNSRWVKNTRGIETNPNETSEDPFVDIESLRDDSKGKEGCSNEADEDATARQGLYSIVNEMSRIEEQSEVDDEEVDLMSFSTDASSHVVSIMTGVNPNNVIEDDVQTTDSDDNLELVQPEIRPLEFDSEDEDFHSVDAQKSTVEELNLAPSNLAPSILAPTPVATSAVTPYRSNGTGQGTPAIRPALKSCTTTPTSALKDPTRSKHQTPFQEKNHRRSVSFSDGKRDGPIQGLNDSSGSASIPFSLDGSDNGDGAASGIITSARSKRIEEMMNALEDSDMDSTPSEGSSSGENINATNVRSSAHKVFSRSHLSPSKQSFNRPNGTFLTECSFGVAHDRLVAAITDIQPFEPYWEELNSIDLSYKSLESVARLKELLPRLDALNLNSNQLAWLSGVPEAVRTLSVASNSLTGLTSFNHLLNLENLDISRNDIDSLRQLDCLRHLRELRADGNKISSLDGLQKMDGLVKLSLQDNLIKIVELGGFRWKRLELLNISHNRLERVSGLQGLQSLIALNLDNNALRTLEVDGSMPRLRILRLSGNRLRQLDVGAVVNLRTLYADNNSLSDVVNLNRLTKLENLSLRNQSGRGLKLLTRDVRDVKRLYLSGNPLQPTFISEACYNLIYLEVAACRLTALPEDMGKLTPNLRVLNLNYNFLEDARPLEGLTRLEKLTIIGSRLKNTKPLIRLAQRMPDIEMLDFRMNPCTLGWYLPLLVKDVPGALQPSEGKPVEAKEEGQSALQQRRKRESENTSSSWQDLDAKFRRDLPDELYIGRLAYRGLIMRACSRIRMLDGVGVSEKERSKAEKLLMGILTKHSNRRKEQMKKR